MSAPTYELNITKGKTLEQTLLYAEERLTYAPIAAIVNKAPLRVRIPAHGIPDGWPVRIQGVSSPSIMNTPEGETVLASVFDADTIEFNSIDANLWGTIEESGSVVYYTPAVITGWKFRMQIKDAPGGNILMDFSSDIADAADGTITVNAASSSFTLGLTDVQSAAITWNGGVYDIEAIRPDGKVVPIIGTSVAIASQEVTVWA